MKAKVKATKSGKGRRNSDEVEASTGNVFADLGFADSEERLLKAKLASKIAELIEKKGWTQAQTAERTSLDQPKVSRLLRGQLSGFSADRIVRYSESTGSQCGSPHLGKGTITREISYARFDCLSTQGGCE
ncbi:MAG TPA: helix-turn-helix transcriptional regulator [Pyrinomonadaceae bacterium]|nr:helix-turn-helix transcriptional regulator [Pyrinomonadaceae bacterium]